MYIPPEFCRVAASWLASMPDHQPLSLLKPIEFEVKKVIPSVPVACADVVLSTVCLDFAACCLFLLVWQPQITTPAHKRFDIRLLVQRNSPSLPLTHTHML